MGQCSGPSCCHTDPHKFRAPHCPLLTSDSVVLCLTDSWGPAPHRTNHRPFTSFWATSCCCQIFFVFLRTPPGHPQGCLAALNLGSLPVVLRGKLTVLEPGSPHAMLGTSNRPHAGRVPHPHHLPATSPILGVWHSRSSGGCAVPRSSLGPRVLPGAGTVGLSPQNTGVTPLPHSGQKRGFRFWSTSNSQHPRPGFICAIFRLEGSVSADAHPPSPSCSLLEGVYVEFKLGMQRGLSTWKYNCEFLKGLIPPSTFHATKSPF